MARALTAARRVSTRPFPLYRSPLQLHMAHTLWTMKHLAYINYMSVNWISGLEGCVARTDVEDETLIIKLRPSLQ